MLKRGIEPQTFALLARRSNQLSYSSTVSHLRLRRKRIHIESKSYAKKRLLRTKRRYEGGHRRLDLCTMLDYTDSGEPFGGYRCLPVIPRVIVTT